MTNPHFIFGPLVRLNLHYLAMTDTFAVLDPRLNYKKLRKDYTGDPELSRYLEKQKELRIYFDVHYPTSVSSKQPVHPQRPLEQRPDQSLLTGLLISTMTAWMTTWRWTN
jgi:hypothetical protein